VVLSSCLAGVAYQPGPLASPFRMLRQELELVYLFCILFPRIGLYVSCHTISGKHPRLGARGLAHHDRSLGVVLLHSRVGAVEERPARKGWSQSIIGLAIRLGDRGCTHLVAALASEVWQKRKRSSFRPWVKTYLPDMMCSLTDMRDIQGLKGATGE
jgi:hypothetical protein